MEQIEYAGTTGEFIAPFVADRHFQDSLTKTGETVHSDLSLMRLIGASPDASQKTIFGVAQAPIIWRDSLDTGRVHDQLVGMIRAIQPSRNSLTAEMISAFKTIYWNYAPVEKNAESQTVFWKLRSKMIEVLNPIIMESALKSMMIKSNNGREKKTLEQKLKVRVGQWSTERTQDTLALISRDLPMEQNPALPGFLLHMRYLQGTLDYVFKNYGGFYNPYTFPAALSYISNLNAALSSGAFVLKSKL
jgi:hypothetical protein